ncbi:MAG: prepilin-type N-terminal cleavage/methylation domain-containing protein [Parcubacteria group bacterium]|nr:prepilin-type N-terminal cleavage/methylation domain-containing protein [Parcubacteria group bacterium]
MRGFTLIELLVVMGITMMLSVSAIGYSRTGEETLNLKMSVQKVLSDINQVTSYALSSPGRKSNPNERYCGFGIHFTQSSDTYVVFGDVKPSGSGQKCSDSDKRYTGTDDILFGSTLKHSTIEGGVSDILFVPPDPTMYVTTVGGSTATTTASIEIKIKGRSDQGSVCVNPIGQATIKRNNPC